MIRLCNPASWPWVASCDVQYSVRSNLCLETFLNLVSTQAVNALTKSFHAFRLPQASPLPASSALYLRSLITLFPFLSLTPFHRIVVVSAVLFFPFPLYLCSFLSFSFSLCFKPAEDGWTRRTNLLVLSCVASSLPIRQCPRMSTFCHALLYSIRLKGLPLTTYHGTNCSCLRSI